MSSVDTEHQLRVTLGASRQVCQTFLPVCYHGGEPLLHPLVPPAVSLRGFEHNDSLQCRGKKYLCHNSPVDTVHSSGMGAALPRPSTHIVGPHQGQSLAIDVALPPR